MIEPATVLLCFVIGIADGDTLTAKCGPDRTAPAIRVRLAEIDAPEKSQPYGTRSKQSLAALCFKRPATITGRSGDRYGRLVATVSCDGVDAGMHQVRAGMAWVFDRYATDPRLPVMQADARRLQLGLWADSSPIPPWNWRQANPIRMNGR